MTDTINGERLQDGPPQDVTAEKAVLGGMMLSNRLIDDVVEILKPGHYYRPANGIIHQAILDLYGRGEPADPITVGNLLNQRGDLARVGGTNYLHGLASEVGNAASAAYYAAIVRDKAERRGVGEELIRGLALLRHGEANAQEVVAQIEAGVSRVLDAPDADGGLIGDELDEYEAELMDIQANGPRQGVKTGFSDLDDLTNGLQPGQMVIVAGRPAMGKSVLAVDFARQAAISDKRAVALYSLEMSKREVLNRIFAATGKIALHHLNRQGGMTDEDKRRYAIAKELLRDASLILRAEPNRTVAQIHAECRRLKRRGQLDMVVIDYLQLIDSGRQKPENRQVEVSAMSRQLKLMAKDLRVPVVVLAQLNRGPEQRSDRRPAVSDLRESGSLEQDADIVILLHREDAYEKESPRSGEADLIVGKHRNGPTATITVAAQLHYSRFVDMAGE
jgi:replicative DNA helicase